MNSSDLALERIVTPNWLPVLPLAGFEVLVVAPVVPGVLEGVVAKADCRF